MKILGILTKTQEAWESDGWIIQRNEQLFSFSHDVKYHIGQSRDLVHLKLTPLRNILTLVGMGQNVLSKSESCISCINFQEPGHISVTLKSCLHCPLPHSPPATPQPAGGHPHLFYVWERRFYQKPRVIFNPPVYLPRYWITPFDLWLY